MGGLNKVTLVGNLCADAEMKFLSSGQAVARLRVATSETYVDKEGGKQEKTEFHTCSLWGKRAEGLAKHLVKGSSVWIEGRLQTRSWDKDGQKHYATEVNVLDIGFAGSGKRDGGGATGSKHQDDFGTSGGGDDQIPF